MAAPNIETAVAVLRLAQEADRDFRLHRLHEEASQSAPEPSPVTSVKTYSPWSIFSELRIACPWRWFSPSNITTCQACSGVSSGSSSSRVLSISSTAHYETNDGLTAVEHAGTAFGVVKNFFSWTRVHESITRWNVTGFRF